jgi:uncharacterized protein HemX
MKCGRAIAEGQVFCSACATAPVVTAPVQLPTKEVTVKKPRKKKEKKQPNYARLCKVWGSATAILATVCILLGGVIYLTITRYQQEQEDLKARAAAVKLRENQADKRDAQIADLQKKLDEAYRQIAQLQTEK